MLAGALKPLTEHQTAKLLAKSPPTESTSPSRRLMSATPPQKIPTGSARTKRNNGTKRLP
jgi:hypothetical protein